MLLKMIAAYAAGRIMNHLSPSAQAVADVTVLTHTWEDASTWEQEEDQ